MEIKGKKPTEEEIYAKLINPHRHHLVELCKGSLRTPLGIIEGEDWYCFTCKEWIGLYGFKFETTPKPSKKAVYIEGKELTKEELEAKKKWESLSEEERQIIKEIWASRDIERMLKKIIRKLQRNYNLTKERIKELIGEALEEI